MEISVAELEKAGKKFEGDYRHLQMHRFPTGLRGLGDRYIVPMLVAIGPYHHDSNPHLKKMEEVKQVAVFCLSQRWAMVGVTHEQVYVAVFAKAKNARKLYYGCANQQQLPNDEQAEFAAMMFFDACFLLFYMEIFYKPKQDDGRVEKEESCCSRFFSLIGFSARTAEEAREEEEEKVDDTYALLQRLLFSNRSCIDSDIMLLENQLPWGVVQAVIDTFPEGPKGYYMNVVENFIIRMGKGFRILEKGKPRPFSWDYGSNNNNNGRPRPPHLLALLRHYKTAEEAGKKPKWPEIDENKASSAMELAEMGIKLTASETALFTDMELKDRGLVCGELSLAPLSLNDTRACWLVNMAAFEVATGSSFSDHHDHTAVCSYLSLFSMFMLREEDVHELRAKCILHGHRTNADMLAFFKTVVQHLPDTGFRFAYTMARVQEYKKTRKVRTKVHKFMYNNFGTIITVLTIVGTLVGIFQALLALDLSEKNADAPRKLLMPFLPA